MRLTDQELKSFNRGFLCAAVSAYSNCYLDASSTLEFLRHVGSFKTLDECLACEPDEYNAGMLKVLFETAKGDGKLKVMTMTRGLKPCPFCGATVQCIIHSLRGLGWSVSCGLCSMEGPYAPTKELAIERWNTRTESMQQTLFDEKKDYHHENKGKLQKI